MGLGSFGRWMIVGCVAFQLSSESAFALIKFDEGRDEIFVTGSLSLGYDSNIYGSKSAEGDFVTTSGVALEYARNAGLISVTGAVSLTLDSFASNSSEDSLNPSFSLELAKKRGRTTGSFTLGASRESQTDVLINQRTESWNYNAGVSVKYPVIDRYSLAGSLGYSVVDYTDNILALTDLSSYSASTDLVYKYSSRRDLLGGYRIRLSDTSTSDKRTIDHSLTFGVSGRILAKLSGSIRAGYQIRNEPDTGESFSSTTASAATTWTVNNRFSISGTLTKDFSTTATSSTVDSLTLSLNAQYTLTKKWAIFGGPGAGQSDFLNGVDTDRQDYFFSWTTGANYTLNEHFKASLSHTYFQNSSNRSDSSFERNTITLNLTSRW